MQFFTFKQLGLISGSLSVAMSTLEDKDNKAHYQEVANLVTEMMKNADEPKQEFDKLTSQLNQRSTDLEEMRVAFARLGRRYQHATQVIAEQAIDLAALRDELAEAKKPTHVHVKSGGYYRVVLRGTLQKAYGRTLQEGDRLVGYIHPSEPEGYFRFEEEFEDGRFKAL